MKQRMFLLGYEVQGLENLSAEEPVLIVYYHGAIPIDLYYFIAKVFMCKNRLVHTVADNFLFKIPGFSIIADCMKVIPGTIQSCASVLKEGNLLAISPGGVYESQFSHQYQLMWKKRLGFAKVALEAKVVSLCSYFVQTLMNFFQAVVPMFTENIREAFRAVSFARRLFLRIYASTKFPFAPIYGGFPVKLISHIGKPIPYDASLTPEQLQVKVANSLNDLIRKHQRIPGSITRGLLDRLPYFRNRYVDSRRNE